MLGGEGACGDLAPSAACSEHMDEVSDSLEKLLEEIQ